MTQQSRLTFELFLTHDFYEQKTLVDPTSRYLVRNRDLRAGRVTSDRLSRDASVSQPHSGLAAQVDTCSFR